MGSVHFVFHLLMRIIPPLIPILAIELGYPLWKLGLLVSMYLTASSIGLIPSGILSDAYDRRVTLTVGLAVVSIGYLLFAYAPVLGPHLPALSISSYTAEGTVITMTVAMFIAGLGSSVHIPVGVPIITSNVNSQEKGKLLGVWGGASKAGDATTPALVGLLILGVPWNDIVLTFGILGLVYATALFGVLSLRQFDTAPAPSSDARSEGESTDGSWRADRRVYLYPMAVLMLYFAGYQIAVQGVVTFTPTFVADVYEYSFTFAGLDFAPESFADFALSTLLLAGAVSRFGAGILVDRYEHKSVLLVTLGVASIALLVFTFVPLGPISLLIVLAVFGGALYGNSPARDTLISELSPTGREGRTFSYLWTASRVFGGLSPVLIGFTADTVGIRRGFGYLTAAVLLAAIAVSMLFSERVYVDGSERNDP